MEQPINMNIIFGCTNINKSIDTTLIPYRFKEQRFNFILEFWKEIIHHHQNRSKIA